MSTDKDDLLSALCHVTVEHGIVPGKGGTCRCEECRLVAQKMEDAGYLDFEEDRWWTKEKEARG